jgi:hypothetical protein
MITVLMVAYIKDPDIKEGFISLCIALDMLFEITGLLVFLERAF